MTSPDAVTWTTRGTPFNIAGEANDVCWAGGSINLFVAVGGGHLTTSPIMTSPDGITVLDLEGRVQFSSPKALELFQLPAAPEGPPRHAFEYVVASDLARAENI